MLSFEEIYSTYVCICMYASVFEYKFGLTHFDTLIFAVVYWRAAVVGNLKTYGVC